MWTVSVTSFLSPIAYSGTVSLLVLLSITHRISRLWFLVQPRARKSCFLWWRSLVRKYCLQAKFHSAAPPLAMAVQYTASRSSLGTSL